MGDSGAGTRHRGASDRSRHAVSGPGSEEHGDWPGWPFLVRERRARPLPRAGAHGPDHADDRGRQRRRARRHDDVSGGARRGSGGSRARWRSTAEPPDQDTRWASAEITLAGARPDPLTLVLQPGVSVPGRVVFDGSEQPPSDLSSFRVVLNSARPSEDGMSSSLAQIAADGRFTLEGVTPGVYRVSVLSPSNWRATILQRRWTRRARLPADRHGEPGGRRCGVDDDHTDVNACGHARRRRRPPCASAHDHRVP